MRPRMSSRAASSLALVCSLSESRRGGLRHDHVQLFESLTATITVRSKARPSANQSPNSTASSPAPDARIRRNVCSAMISASCSSSALVATGQARRRVRWYGAGSTRQGSRHAPAPFAARVHACVRRSQMRIVEKVVHGGIQQPCKNRWFRCFLYHSLTLLLKCAPSQARAAASIASSDCP